MDARVKCLYLAKCIRIQERRINTLWTEGSYTGEENCNNSIKEYRIWKLCSLAPRLKTLRKPLLKPLLKPLQGVSSRT